MFLPKSKSHFLPIRLLSRPLNLLRRRIRPAEINPHVRLQTPLQPANIPPIHDPIPHRREKFLEIRSPKICSGLQLGERIFGRTNAVKVDVGRGVDIHLLSEVGVDAEELGAGTRIGGSVLGLLFEAAKEGLEPFEGGGVSADPDELNSAETRGRIRTGAQVPNVFEDAGPGGNSDAGPDKDCDFVVEDIFSGSAVGSVNADSGH